MLPEARTTLRGTRNLTKVPTRSVQEKRENYVDVDHNHLRECEAREEKDLSLSLHHEVQLQLTQQLPQHRRVRRQPSVLHTF
jgi:hypothetical protein